jgi:SNF2 family DNA or RNA helicase
MDEEGQEHVLDTSKIDSVMEVIEGIDDTEPVVVFARFKAEVRMLCEKLEKAHISHSKLVGGTNELEEWQNGHTRVLVMNIQSGALGIDCTRARYNLYISTGYNYANYDQSLARTRRPGADTEKKVFYYHFIARSTVDEKVSQAMIQKESVIDAILNDLGRFQNNCKKAA